MMKMIRLDMLGLHCWSRLAVLFVIMVSLLGAACLPSPPPPPEPPPEPENQPPIISGITADKEVMPSTECLVSCQATDPDGDDLSYWWSANGGMIKREGDNVTWIAPELDGDYAVSVMVMDGNGGEAIDSVTITVLAKPNQPPVIISLLREGSPPPEPNSLRVWRTTNIECVAEDPDGDDLSFIWLATDGVIQGEGATVGWTAPGDGGDYTVTVIVSDGRGDEAEASMEFEVVCCGR